MWLCSRLLGCIRSKMSQLTDTLAQFETALATASVEDLPLVAGRLESLKAVVWSRILQVSTTPQQVLTVHEAADLLRVSKSWLRQNTTIPRQRRPGSRIILFNRQDLQAFLDAGKVAESASIPEAPKDSTKGVDTALNPVYHRRASYR